MPNANASVPLISLHDVGYRVGGKWLVEHVDLCIQAGEICTLIGPNGSGKSTTVKLACGVLTPSAGSVTRRANLRVGYVPQSVEINANLPITVQRFLSVSTSHTQQQADEVMQMVGLKVDPKQSVQSLSGGEFQRLLIARALLRKPELLVLDEPVQGVDYTGEIEIYELIGQIRQDLGCGILLVSHDLHIVMAATDTVICLNGHICCRGTPQSVLSDPAYVDLFGERAAGTLAIYMHEHDHTHANDGSVHPHCEH